MSIIWSVLQKQRGTNKFLKFLNNLKTTVIAQIYQGGGEDQNCKHVLFYLRSKMVNNSESTDTCYVFITEINY